jgi:hypothetical protein
MGDVQLMRLILSNDFDKFAEFARHVAEKHANRMSMSSGEQRLVDMLEKMNTAYDFWVDQRWSMTHLPNPLAAE